MEGFHNPTEIKMTPYEIVEAFQPSLEMIDECIKLYFDEQDFRNAMSGLQGWALDYAKMAYKSRLGSEVWKHIKRLKNIRRIVDTPKTIGNVISQADIERAKNVPIKRLYDFDKMTQYRDNRLKACCPFHKEKTPSFYIFKNNKFYCFGCKAYGDAINFVMATKGIDFKSSVNFLINH